MYQVSNYYIMRPARVIASFIGVILLFTTACQVGEQDDESELPQPQNLEEAALHIDFDQDALTQPASMDLTDDGDIAVLNFQSKEVLIYNREGILTSRFGGEGKGPGEFMQPRHMDVHHDTISVVDFELRRVTLFNREGNILRTFPFEGSPYSGTITVIDGTEYFAPAVGVENSLIQRIHIETDSVRYFGEAMGPPVESVVDLEKQRQILASGEVPPLYDNLIKTRLYGDYLYVFLEGHSRLRKYDLDGERIWETEIDLPVKNAIFQGMVERAKNSPENTTPSLRYLSSFKVVEGDAYLFWDPKEGYERKLVKVSANGTIEAIYHVPENGEEPIYSNFAIDPESNTLYLASYPLGQIFRTRLPE